MQILSSDELLKLEDREVRNIFLKLRSSIKELENKSSKKIDDEYLKNIQTYYCYVYRELEHRRIV